MFRNKYQAGKLDILCGSGLDPLAVWSRKGRGCIKRIFDEDIQSLVVEITAILFCASYISIPLNPRTVLGIRLPCLTIILKYLKLPFCFEFVVLDSRGVKRRFRASNCKTSQTITPLLCHLPLALDDGWNKIMIEMREFTRLAYNSDFVEFLAMQIYANCRVRRVFFSDHWFADHELPDKYKMYKPKVEAESISPKVEAESSSPKEES